MESLADGVDLIVINRFGRAESLGKGLLGCFTAAVEIWNTCSYGRAPAL